jgi:hypothetical protein
VPEPLAQRRIHEIDADLHDHTEHERARGTGDRRIALSIAARMIRGLAADLSWRSNRREAMSNSTRRSVLRVALVTGLILLIPAVMMAAGGDADWGVFDFVFAGVLIAGTGFLLELAVRRPRSLALNVGVAAIGVAAIAFGEADDAPGLVLFGLLLIVGTVGLAVRTAVRSH